MIINARKSVTALAAIAVVSSVSPAWADDDESWRVELVPYAWIAGIDGDVGVGGREAELDASFSDLWDNLDMAAALLANARINSWVIRAQIDYLDLSSDLARANGSFESETTMASLGFGYQFKLGGGGHTLDLLIGARNLAMDSKLKLDALGNSDSDEDFTDPIVMLEPSFRLSDRWRFNAMLSYGEGGDSDYTYEVQPQLIFQAWKHVELRLGYRLLHYKLDSGRNERTSFDGDFEGPFIGLGVSFGSGPKPAPAPVAAAEPAPLPPPPPADGDGDGVPDERDQCPNTPRGQRVDAVGCGYEIHVEALFDSDSAKIKPESHEALDRAVDLLKRVPTMRGVIEGHTDSTGSAAHNQALSERRAAAVSDYLVERGIDASRVPSKGLGESDPVADNHTAEGRALNRRVVLRRTDGG